MTAEARHALLPDAVYASLREAIIGLRHPPGATLTELGVSRTYRVARPTARVALQRLVDDGLLRRDAHRSARVPELTAEDVHDLYGARVMVEEAALRAVAATGQVPEAALETHERLRALASADDHAPFVREDMNFHRALVLASGSPRLQRMHGLIMGEVELCMGQLQHHHLMSARTVAHEHQGILDAVAIGDVELTAAVTRAHILMARNRLIARSESVRLTLAGDGVPPAEPDGRDSTGGASRGPSRPGPTT